MMNERELENYIVHNHDCIEDDLVFMGQQQRVAGKRIDLLFESSKGEVVVVEVKKVAKRKDVAQLFDYAGYFIESTDKPIRVILVAYRIPRNFMKAFDYFGIEYYEIPEIVVSEFIGSNESKEQSDSDNHPDTSSEKQSNYKDNRASTKNETRKSIAKRLKQGKSINQASQILHLIRRNSTGVFMNEIVSEMKSKGHKGKSYYDICNAMIDAGMIRRFKEGRTFKYLIVNE